MSKAIRHTFIRNKAETEIHLARGGSNVCWYSYFFTQQDEDHFKYIIEHSEQKLKNYAPEHYEYLGYYFEGPFENEPFKRIVFAAADPKDVVKRLKR